MMSGAETGRIATPHPALEGLALHHVGCAVRSIEKALAFYSGVLGFRQLTDPIPVPSQKVRVCFVSLGPGQMLELVEGAGPGSPVEQLLERTGGGVYHLCFQVRDLDAALRHFRAQGCLRLKRFEQAVQGLRRFAFLLTPDRHLFELCEAE